MKPEEAREQLYRCAMGLCYNCPESNDGHCHDMIHLANKTLKEFYEKNSKRKLFKRN